MTPFRERRHDELRIQFRSPRRHPGAGRAGAQPEEHRRRCAAPQDRRHCGRVRLRQVLAGAGCPLRRGLSPRYIKIDISIVRGIDTDRDKQQIVSNIVAYAHARSMQLIAEGIETEAQLRTVIGLGVDLLQGYYLSRPAAVPAPIAPAAQAVIDQLEHQRFNPLGL